MAVWRGMTHDQPPLAWMAVRLWNTWLHVWNWYALASRPVPVQTDTVSGPYFSVSSRYFSTMISYASSHEMRSHLSGWPRYARSRFMGYRRRSSW